MSNLPAISVILPTFNRAHVLSRAINSVLVQTSPNLELIVVDDASTDVTESVVKSISDPRLRYLRLDRNRGPAHARNRGFEATRGRLIAYLDSDDEWLPEKLALQVRLLDEAPTDVGLVVGSYVLDTGDGRVQLVRVSRKRGPFHERQLLSAFCPIPSTWLARREALLDAGFFDEQMTSDSDWEMLFNITRRWRLQASPEVVAMKHQTPGSVGSNWEALIANYNLILDRHRDRWADAPKLMAAPYLVMAIAHCEMGQIDASRRRLRMAFRVRPLWWKVLLLHLSLLFGQRGYRAFRSARDLLKGIRRPERHLSPSNR